MRSETIGVSYGRNLRIAETACTFDALQGERRLIIAFRFRAARNGLFPKLPASTGTSKRLDIECGRKG
jgi:hypothetical protein